MHKSNTSGIHSTNKLLRYLALAVSMFPSDSSLNGLQNPKVEPSIDVLIGKRNN